MATTDDNYARGLLLTATGGLALTADIPLIKLADGEPWSILMLRGVTTFVVAIAVWLIWRAASDKAPQLIPGKSGLLVAALYGATSLTFITAVYNTSTANLVFILAFNTMFAALLSWMFLRQRPRPVTFAAMAAMILGIGIIVGDSIGSGTLFGDFMAGLSAFMVAAAITVTRATGRDMGFAALVAVIIPAAVAAVMVLHTGYDVAEPWWIIFNGAVVMPISFFCLATGPKYISGPEVAMFYLLETVLAPIWVWLIFAERPTTQSLIGGAILVAALVAHSLWQLLEGRRRKAARVIRHPV
ncbi:MAG: DMT family transporter [Brucellaceae bacterium]|nr:DMT family transporter [Brucellaceae bacterium]